MATKEQKIEKAMAEQEAKAKQDYEKFRKEIEEIGERYGICVFGCMCKRTDDKEIEGKKYGGVTVAGLATGNMETTLKTSDDFKTLYKGLVNTAQHVANAYVLHEMATTSVKQQENG